jgi:hypothetical protein
MKMKYLSHLNAIMTLAMVCLQGALAFSSVFENGPFDNHHYHLKVLVLFRATFVIWGHPKNALYILYIVVLVI